MSKNLVYENGNASHFKFNSQSFFYDFQFPSLPDESHHAQSILSINVDVYGS